MISKLIGEEGGGGDGGESSLKRDRVRIAKYGVSHGFRFFLKRRLADIRQIISPVLPAKSTHI